MNDRGRRVTGFIIAGLALAAGTPLAAQERLRAGMSADAFLRAYYAVHTPWGVHSGTRRVYLNGTVPLYRDYASVCRAVAAGNAVGVRSGAYRAAGPTLLGPVVAAVVAAGGFSWLSSDKMDPVLATGPGTGEPPTCGTKITSLTTVERIGGYDYMGTQGNRIIEPPWYTVNRVYVLRGGAVVAGYVVQNSVQTCAADVRGGCAADTAELRAKDAQR